MYKPERGPCEEAWKWSGGGGTPAFVPAPPGLGCSCLTSGPETREGGGKLSIFLVFRHSLTGNCVTACDTVLRWGSPRCWGHRPHSCCNPHNARDWPDSGELQFHGSFQAPSQDSGSRGTRFLSAQHCRTGKVASVQEKSLWTHRCTLEIQKSPTA